MRLTLTALGWELDLIVGPTVEAVEYDQAHDLSGGTLASDRIEPGPTDHHLGFTNGREDAE